MTDLSELKLWPEICNALTSKYQILNGFDICSYGDNMELLAERLRPYQSYNFASNERLIFTMWDTEYYLPMQSTVGLTHSNFILLLYSLDISFSHCIFFTNHHGITKHLNSLCQYYGHSHGMNVLENNYTLPQTRSVVADRNRTSDTIQYHFAFLSNVKRDHRSYIRCYLEDRQLNDHTLMAWGTGDYRREQLDGEIESAPCCTFVVPTPYTRINDKIIPSVELNNLFVKNHNCLSGVYQHPLIKHSANVDNFNADFLQHTFLNIVAETAFDYPYPYLTEKTFKCFWEQSPFILAGAPHSLEYLKSIGFKTFDHWWDESYDQITNPAERLSAIFKVLDTISNWSLDQCREVYNDMKVVLEHNNTHYKTYYCHELLEQNINQL